MRRNFIRTPTARTWDREIPTGNGYQRRTVYRNSAAWNRNDNWDNNGWQNSWNDNRWDRRYDHGFGPGEVAAGVAGAAIGTAGAMATAPFHDDSYPYYNDNSYRYDTTYRGRPHQNYAPQRAKLLEAQRVRL